MNKSLLAAGISLLIPLITPLSSKAQLLPPDVLVNGASQSELSASWWQWGLSYPDGQNPIQDEIGAYSYLGDQGSVFFLAGSFGNPVIRSVTVSSNQTLFFPLINTISIITQNGETETGIRQDASDSIGIVKKLFLKLNGHDLPLPSSTNSLEDYRQFSPLFNLKIPDNSIFGAILPEGTYSSVSDGFWAALQPLETGNYILNFGGSTVGTGPYQGLPFNQDITYQITVKPVPEPALISGLITLALLGATSLKRKKS
jgi:hypothetical protein